MPLRLPLRGKALSIPFLTGLIYRNPALKGGTPLDHQGFHTFPNACRKSSTRFQCLKTCFTSMMRLHNNLQYLQPTRLQTWWRNVAVILLYLHFKQMIKSSLYHLFGLLFPCCLCQSGSCNRLLCFCRLRIFQLFRCFCSHFWGSFFIFSHNKNSLKLVILKL